MSRIPETLPISNFAQRLSSPELITRTLLTERLQQSEPKLTSWGLRKAEQQGLIHPDKIGRFAGHAVHYYDAARIPELIRQLLPPVSWTAGTLIIHPHLGPGRILCADPADPSRRVIFFSILLQPASGSPTYGDYYRRG